MMSNSRTTYFIQNTGWSYGTSWFDGTKVFYTKKEADEYLKGCNKLQNCLYRVVKRTVHSTKYTQVTTLRFYKIVGKLKDGCE